MTSAPGVQAQRQLTVRESYAQVLGSSDRGGGEQPSVTFVVPTCRRPEALRTTLSALLGLDYPAGRYEVIVVDDAAEAGARAVVDALAPDRPRVRYLAQAGAGVATARNAGAAMASGQLLIFLDDDIVVERDHVERHLRVRADYGDCLVNGHWEFAPAVLAALQRTPFGRFRIGVEDWVKTAIAFEPLGDRRLRPSGLTACNLSVSANCFWELGGFDESFPFAGCEDQEFSHRAKLAGCTFVYDPGIRLLHNDGRVTLRQFCDRQRRGALTSVYLVARHPSYFAETPLLLENSLITRSDPVKLRVKKLAKRLYSSRPGLAAAGAATRLLERTAPNSRLLSRLYTMTIGAHIYLGVREGLASLPEVNDVAASARSGISAHA
jgi:GT2 family glycosyltransferase